MKIRIGKDLNIRWSILTNNEPTPLEGRNINILLQDPSRQQRALSFTTEGNTIISYIPAAELTRLGDYILTLKENEGEEGQTVVDAKPAFTLVEYSTEESSEPTDPSLSVADITLSTANLTNGITIQDVFSGEDGGTIQEGDIVPVLRGGKLQRVEHGAPSAKKKKEPYRGIIHKAIPLNPHPGTAYIFRGHKPHISFIVENLDSIPIYVEFMRKYYIDEGWEKLKFIYSSNIILYYIDESGISRVKYFKIKTYISETKRFIEDNCIYNYRISIVFYSGCVLHNDLAFYINDKDPLSSSNRLLYANENIKMVSSNYRLYGGKVCFVGIPTIIEKCTCVRNTILYRMRRHAHGEKRDRKYRYIVKSSDFREKKISVLITRAESFDFARYSSNRNCYMPRGKSLFHFTGPVKALANMFNFMGGVVFFPTK